MIINTITKDQFIIKEIEFVPCLPGFSEVSGRNLFYLLALLIQKHFIAFCSLGSIGFSYFFI
jgi:hypothetical protein